MIKQHKQETCKSLTLQVIAQKTSGLCDQQILIKCNILFRTLFFRIEHSLMNQKFLTGFLKICMAGGRSKS